MYDLFNPYPTNIENIKKIQIFNDVTLVKGLTYIPDFINKEEEVDLIKHINNQQWLADIKRRVQHYGYKYDYKARTINYSMYLGPLPSWVNTIANRLHLEKYIEEYPDQLIINEYEPGQGIANHIDCEPCFGETITSISLGSYCVMDFINCKTKQKVEVMMEPRSLVIINGEARHMWTHGIAQRKADVFSNQKINRSLRISLTFRKVVLKN
jgi:alkylated DNA repair dioxygenase AlkB